MRRWVIVLLFLLAATPAFGEGLCSTALIADIYNSTSETRNDFRVAEYVSEASWNRISGSAGAAAMLFGIPVGGSFSAYHAAAHEKVVETNTAIRQSDAEAIIHAALDNEAVPAYKTCLQNFEGGLHAWIVSGQQPQQVTVAIHWASPDGRPLTPLSFQPGAAPAGAAYPASIASGQTALVTFDRPATPFTFYVQGKGVASEMIEIGPWVPALTGCSGHHAGLQGEGTVDHLVCSADFAGRTPTLTIDRFSFRGNFPAMRMEFAFQMDKRNLISSGPLYGPVENMPAKYALSDPLTDGPHRIDMDIVSCRNMPNFSREGVQCDYGFDWSLY